MAYVENLSAEAQNLIWVIYNSQTHGLDLQNILNILKNIKIFKADLISEFQTPRIKTGLYFVNSFDKICQLQYTIDNGDFDCRGDRSLSIFCNFRRIKKELRNLKRLKALDLPSWEEKMNKNNPIIE